MDFGSFLFPRKTAASLIVSLFVLGMPLSAGDRLDLRFPSLSPVPLAAEVPVVFHTGLFSSSGNESIFRII